MSTLTVGTIKSNGTSPPTIQDSAGTQIGTFCRAWVNFNGTGAVAIRDDFNVSSITDNGTGDYTINFTTAMSDANYAAVATISDSDAASAFRGIHIYDGTTYSATATRFLCEGSSGTNYDPTYVCVSIFR
jgi:hypothetical protein